MKKYFSPLFGLAVLAYGLVASHVCYAIPTTDADALYSDSLYIERSSAEVPQSFESSARESQAAYESAADAGADRAIESMADLDGSKKSSKN